MVLLVQLVGSARKYHQAGSTGISCLSTLLNALILIATTCSVLCPCLLTLYHHCLGGVALLLLLGLAVTTTLPAVMAPGDHCDRDA